MSLERVEIAPGRPIPRIVVGGWQLSEGHRRTPRDRDDVLDTLHLLADAGFTAFDCADIYTGVEELLGDFRARYRERAGPEAAGRLRVHTKLVPDRAALPSVDRGYVERIVDRSLRRLRVERLDLVQLAWWDYAVPGYVDAARWLDELQRAGKVRLLGVTNFDVPRLVEILDAGVEIATQQVQYSLLDTRPEHGMAGFCRERGIHLLCYGTLAGGFLSGRWLGADDPRPPLPNRSLTKYRLIIDEAGGWGRYQELLEILASIAGRRGCSIAQVALRWVLDRPAVAAALVGITRYERMAECRDAVGLRLSDADRAEIAAWLDAGPGPRGDVFGLEREPGGRHASIMKYDLNAAG